MPSGIMRADEIAPRRYVKPMEFRRRQRRRRRQIDRRRTRAAPTTSTAAATAAAEQPLPRRARPSPPPSGCAPSSTRPRALRARSRGRARSGNGLRAASRDSGGRCDRASPAVRIDLGELRRILFQDRVHRLDVRIALEGAAGRSASRRGSRRTKRCPCDGRAAGRGPARATCSRPCPARCPAAVSATLRLAGIRCRLPAVPRRFRQPEVEDLHDPVPGDEDVLRLQIAMDDAALVRGGDAADDVDAEVDGLADGQRVLAHSRAERVALRAAR